MELRYRKKFIKRFKKFSPKIKNLITDTLDVFQENENDVTLRRHTLKGKLKIFDSLDVTGDIRIFIYPQTNEIVDVVDVGTHSQLY